MSTKKIAKIALRKVDFLAEELGYEISTNSCDYLTNEDWRKSNGKKIVSIREELNEIKSMFTFLTDYLKIEIIQNTDLLPKYKIVKKN